MVELKDGEISNIMPGNLKTPETEALSYSIKEAQQNLLKFAAAIQLYAGIEQTPDSALDLMALELNTQYYDQSLPRKKKERLVMQTLAWYMHAGTPSVLAELMETILEGGYTEEWYKYGGEPYHFRAYAYAGDNEIQLGYGLEIKRRIETYKNVRSWLDYFMFIILMETKIPIAYNYSMVVSLQSYPWGDIPLKLNGRWKLNGERKLGKYEQDINRYPVTVAFLAEALQEVMGENGLGLRLESNTEFGARALTEYRVDAEMQAHMKGDLSVSIGTDMAFGIGIIEIMVINRLDRSWKLDCSRKLNGGLYLR